MPARKLSTKQKAKKERRQVRLACVACRKAKTACDEQRPCNRCFSKGIENCVDAPKKSRSNKKSCVSCREDKHSHTQTKSSACSNLETFSKCSQSASPQDDTVEETVSFVIDSVSVVEVKPDCCTTNFDFLAQFLGNIDIDSDPSLEYAPFGINVLSVMSITPSFDQMLASIMQG